MLLEGASSIVPYAETASSSRGYDSSHYSQLLPKDNVEQLTASLANSIDAASKVDLLTDVLHHHGLELDSLIALAVS